MAQYISVAFTHSFTPFHHTPPKNLTREDYFTPFHHIPPKNLTQEDMVEAVADKMEDAAEDIGVRRWRCSRLNTHQGDCVCVVYPVRVDIRLTGVQVEHTSG